MSEEQDVQILNVNKKKSDSLEKELKQENNEELNSSNEVKNRNKIEENVGVQNSENKKLQLNEKNIYPLPSETIEKLNLSPCPICQSKKYSVYLPVANVSLNYQPQNKEQQQTNNNDELQTVNNNPKQIYSFPVLICEEKHQFCLFCNKFFHQDSPCQEEYLNQDNINSKLEIIKDALPEEKKNALDSMNNNNLIKQTKSCCSCSCTCYTILFIFLLLLWTIASIALVALGVAALFIAYALRIVCCLYHCCWDACCTTSVKEEDKGDYILRTTTIDVGKKEEIKREAAETDDCLVNCAPLVLAYSIMLIPEGYTKICNLYGGWRENI